MSGTTSMAPESAPAFVDTVAAFKRLLDEIEKLPPQPPLLFLPEADRAKFNGYHIPENIRFSPLVDVMVALPRAVELAAWRKAEVITLERL